MPLRLVIVAAIIVASTPAAFAQDPTVFERVLVPISISNVPGGYGSLWSTELWYRNNGTVPVAIFPLRIADDVPTVGRTTFLEVFTFPADAPGQILFANRPGLDDVQFDLRLFNRADRAGSWGTKLPVVRERQFAKTVSLINIPVRPEFRSALRIYGLPEELVGADAVRISIYSADERLLVSTEVETKDWPRYAQVLSLADSFPELRTVDTVRVHIESLTETPIWAFVSVASNSTQHVSIITPD